MRLALSKLSEPCFRRVVAYIKYTIKMQGVQDKLLSARGDSWRGSRSLALSFLLDQLYLLQMKELAVLL